MPKFTPNRLFIQALKGTIGDLVFYEDADGNSIIQRKGKRKVPPSEKQLGSNDRFKLAAVYGKMVQADPVLSAEYRPLCRGRMAPYHVALRDFLTPPKLVAIDLQSFSGQPGQLIRMIATDDSRVLSVQVVVRHAISQAIIEQGASGPSVIADQWLYTTRTVIRSGTPVLLEATAADRPGNLGAANMHFIIP